MSEDEKTPHATKPIGNDALYQKELEKLERKKTQPPRISRMDLILLVSILLFWLISMLIWYLIPPKRVSKPIGLHSANQEKPAKPITLEDLPPLDNDLFEEIQDEALPKEEKPPFPPEPPLETRIEPTNELRGETQLVPERPPDTREKKDPIDALSQPEELLDQPPAP